APQPDPQAGETEAQPALEPQVDAQQVPAVEDLPRERLLVGRAEVVEDLFFSGLATLRRSVRQRRTLLRSVANHRERMRSGSTTMRRVPWFVAPWVGLILGFSVLGEEPPP